MDKINEISNELLQRYKQKAGAQVDNPATPSSIKYKRGLGHLMATVKQMKSGKPMPPVKEEADQLDELSPMTLASYKEKARQAIKNLQPHAKSGEYKDIAKNIIKRREAGLAKVKEDVEMNEAVSVIKKNYSWGKMVTVHHGADTSYPLHPEHQKEIAKLRDGDKTSFKDETGRRVHVHREGNKVHLMTKETGYKPTAVDYKHFEESNLSLFKTFKDQITEKTLTTAEKKKREEVAKAIEREHPGMPMGMKMAIATKTAKRVAEEFDLQEGADAQKRFQEYHNETAKLMKGIHKALSNHYSSNSKSAHWGHVGDVRSIHDQLRDVHDRLMQQGEYAKEEKKYMPVREETEYEVEEGEHYCAKHVYSKMYGEGVVVEGMHADPDENGNIDWYAVEFKEGIKKVYTENLEVMLAEYHGNHKRKRKVMGQ